jgi:Mce-associated membrane protein
MPSSRPSRWATVTIIVSGLIAVVALSGCGFLGWTLVADGAAVPDTSEGWRVQLSRDREAHKAGQQAQEASAAFALLMINTDYRDVDRNRSQILEKSTGAFKEKYTKSSAQLRQILVDNKAKSSGKVIDSAIHTESVDKVIMLLFIDQTVTNVAVPDGRVDRSRLRMTMEKVDGRWLASDVELI